MTRQAKPGGSRQPFASGSPRGPRLVRLETLKVPPGALSPESLQAVSKGLASTADRYRMLRATNSRRLLLPAFESEFPGLNVGMTAFLPRMAAAPDYTEIKSTSLVAHTTLPVRGSRGVQGTGYPCHRVTHTTPPGTT